MPWLRSRLVVLVLGILLFSVSFTLTYTRAIDVLSFWRSHNPVRADTTVAASGQELVFVYVGSASCRPSNVSDMPGIVRNTRNAVEALAGAAGVGFRTIGVARDAESRRGLEHLAKFDDFDEVSAGSGLLNTTTAKLFSDLSGSPATPQVIVVLRTVVRNDGMVAVGDERLVARKIGLNELQEWNRANGVLPGLRIGANRSPLN